MQRGEYEELFVNGAEFLALLYLPGLLDSMPVICLVVLLPKKKSTSL